MTRLLDIARIQLVNWPALVAYPLGLLVAMPLLGWGIDVSNGETGGSPHTIFLLPMVWGVVASGHLQSMTQVFPFALGLGVTRRRFAAATALVVTAQALLLGLGLVVCAAIERATGGWGREARIFGLGALRTDDPFTQWLSYSGLIIGASALCVLVGTVFQRWRQTGIYLSVFGTTALLAGIGSLASSQNWWPAIGRFFDDWPSLTVFTAFPLALALALGGAAWLVLRRATP